MSKINKGYVVYFAGNFYDIKNKKEAEAALELSRFYQELNSQYTVPPINEYTILNLNTTEKEFNSLTLKDVNLGYDALIGNKINIGYHMRFQFDPSTRKIVPNNCIDTTPCFDLFEDMNNPDFGDSNMCTLDVTSRNIEICKRFTVRRKCDNVVDFGTIRSSCLVSELDKAEGKSPNPLHYIRLERVFADTNKYKTYENMKLKEFREMCIEDSKYFFNEYNTRLTSFTKKTTTRIKKVFGLFDEIRDL